MVVLCCPQCKTRLPVAPEKLGKALFVCPSCSFPLEAANAVADDTVAYVAPANRVPAAPPANRVAPAALRDSVPAVPVPRAKVTKAMSATPEADAPAANPQAGRGRRGWAVAGLGAGAAALLAGTLYLTLGRSGASKTTDAEEASVTDMLDVLALSKVLEEGDTDARRKAALSLAKAGREARAAFPALLEGLRNEDETLRDLVRNALDEAGPPDKEDAPVVSLALRDEDPDVRAYAAAVVPALGEEGWGETAQVRALTEDPDPYVSAAAKKSLEQLEQDQLDALTLKLRDSNPNVRSEAARSLADLGGASKGATAGLVEALADENDGVRVAARESLAQMGTDVVPVLTETMVRNRNLEARRSSLVTLSGMGENSLEAIPAVADMLEDPALSGDAGTAIERYGEYAVAALAERVVRSRTEVLREVYRSAIVRIGPRGLPALNTYISRNVTVNKQFTTVINKLGAPGPVTVIVAPAVGAGGRIYKDLLVQFEGWDRHKRGRLDHDDLRRVFGGDERLAHAYLRRLDREGKGYLSRHDYERWAAEHARRLVREREARESLHHAHDRLGKQVKEGTKHDQARAAEALTRLRDEEKHRRDHPVTSKQKQPDHPGKSPNHAKDRETHDKARHEREVALASLQAQRRKEHAQQQRARTDVLRRQHEVQKIHRQQGPAARHVTPAKYQPPRPKPSVQKPPTRRPPPPPRYSPPPRPAPPRPAHPPRKR